MTKAKTGADIIRAKRTAAGIKPAGVRKLVRAATTPARAHYQRATAAAGKATPAAETQASSQDKLMLAALHAARRRLKDIKALDRKIAAKRELLPQFDAYLEGVLQADAGGENLVLVYALLWRFDVGDLQGALALSDYALRHGLSAPDTHQRDLPSIIAEQTAEEVLKALAIDGADAPFLTAACLAAAELTDARDLHDQIRAKLRKAHGYALRAAGDLPGAVAQLTDALALNSKIGVKRDIENLERDIKKQGAAG